jgi:hypothetical protein
MLRRTVIVPSRKILKEKTEERFQRLKMCGIYNLQDCLAALKTTGNVSEISEKTDLAEDYLLTLRREINSFLPKPINFEKIPDIKTEVLEKLGKAGIKNTKQLFYKTKTKEARKMLSQQTGISEADLIELVKLTDISRIKWIGPIFARLFYESGIDTTEKISNANAEELFKTLKEINEKNNYTKSNFIENDVRICIDVAKDVPKVIEY